MDAHRLIYLSSFEYPSTHGHPLHALSMARAFAGLLGDRFLFVVGKGNGLEGLRYQAPFAAVLPIVKALRLRALVSALWLTAFLMPNPLWRKDLIVFTNDLRLAALLGPAKRLHEFKVILEVHGSAGEVADRTALKNADKIIFVTEGLRKQFSETYPGISGKSVVMGNAVDVESFNSASAGNLRAELGIPETDTLIGYVGRFKPMESDKGVNFLIDTLPLLPPDTQLLLVGGTGDEIEEARVRAIEKGVGTRVHLVQFVPFEKRVTYVLAPDILAYVPPKEDRFLSEETSPMKLYEYMAAKRPIIASDMPAFREALDDETAYLILPGSTDAFVRAVAEIRSTPDQARLKVEHAYALVSLNTWESRARRILELV